MHLPTVFCILFVVGVSELTVGLGFLCVCVCFVFGKAVELMLKRLFPVTSVVHLSRYASVIREMYFKCTLLC